MKMCDCHSCVMHRETRLHIDEAVTLLARRIDELSSENLKMSKRIQVLEGIDKMRLMEPARP